MASSRRKPGVPGLPDPVDRASSPFVLAGAGWWLLLSDVHLPFHDRATVELAVAAALRHKVRGVLLNGDILDCHALSRWDKSPDDPRYPEEIRMGLEFLAWLRWKLGKRPRIVWKDGNHEERLQTYLVRKAPELFGLEALTIPSLLDFRRFGVEYVTDRRVITAGKLHILHGHEYTFSIQNPVNPARGLFLRAKGNALCGHFHQVSEHTEPTISGKPQAAWSTGCACGLSPFYLPFNKWGHGFALVRVGQGGMFEVRNHRVLDGEVV